MALLSISAFVAKWNSRFADNSSRAIEEDDMREFEQDISDSFFNKVDEVFTGIKGLRSSISTIANLKTVVSGNLSTGVTIVFRDTGSSDVLRVYELVAGADAESSPNVIRPNDYTASTNEKVWKLAGSGAGDELTSNKATNLGTINDTKYPSVKSLFNKRDVTGADSIVS